MEDFYVAVVDGPVLREHDTGFFFVCDQWAEAVVEFGFGVDEDEAGSGGVVADAYAGGGEALWFCFGGRRSESCFSRLLCWRRPPSPDAPLMMRSMGSGWRASSLEIQRTRRAFYSAFTGTPTLPYGSWTGHEQWSAAHDTLSSWPNTVAT